MSNPIEEATLELYAADDGTKSVFGRCSSEHCSTIAQECHPWACCHAMADATRRQRAAENGLLAAVRNARPRS